MITEENLINLGFQRVDSNDGEGEYHYYTLDIGHDYTPFCLISSANDEINEGEGYQIFIFDYSSILIDNMTDLTTLINVLQKSVVEK